MEKLNLTSLQQLSERDLLAIAKSNELDSKIQRLLVELAMLKYQAAVESSKYDNYNSYALPEFVGTLAGNPNLTQENCKKLAEMQSEDVIHNIASNMNTPATVLKKLCNDYLKHFQFTIANIIRNPNCPHTLALAIAMDEDLREEEDVIGALLNYKDWTDSDLEKLARIGVEGFGDK